MMLYMTIQHSWEPVNPADISIDLEAILEKVYHVWLINLGSQIPLFETRSDGRDNLVGALILGKLIIGQCVQMDLLHISWTLYQIFMFSYKMNLVVGYNNDVLNPPLPLDKQTDQ